MDKMEVLNRLVSIRNNADRKAWEEFKTNESIKIKAANLEYGINQLIMEIQNSILADNYKNKKKRKLFKIRYVFYLKPTIKIKL